MTQSKKFDPFWKPEPKKEVASDGKRPGLLVIDDDSVIRVTLETALGKQYNVISLSNGEEVVLQIENYKPDLLILDINMPGSDGFEICKEVRAQAKLRNLPILFMTARKDDASFLKSLETGGDSYIPKPFEMPDLRERIEYLLKSCQAS